MYGLDRYGRAASYLHIFVYSFQIQLNNQPGLNRLYNFIILESFTLSNSIKSVYFLDINECTSGTDPCGANTVCTNNEGSYTCPCVDGFADDGSGACAGVYTSTVLKRSYYELPIILQKLTLYLKF